MRTCESWRRRWPGWEPRARECIRARTRCIHTEEGARGGGGGGRTRTGVRGALRGRGRARASAGASERASERRVQDNLMGSNRDVHVCVCVYMCTHLCTHVYRQQTGQGEHKASEREHIHTPRVRARGRLAERVAGLYSAHMRTGRMRRRRPFCERVRPPAQKLWANWMTPRGQGGRERVAGAEGGSRERERERCRSAQRAQGARSPSREGGAKVTLTDIYVR